MRTEPLQPQGLGLGRAFVQQIMNMSKILNCAVHTEVDGLEPLVEDVDHRCAELSARFSIAANFPIEALEVAPLTSFRYRAIQHFRQFFVSHPNLRHGYPVEDLGRPSTNSRPRIAILDTNI
jgi:hypothetical protein